MLVHSCETPHLNDVYSKNAHLILKRCYCNVVRPNYFFVLVLLKDNLIKQTASASSPLLLCGFRSKARVSFNKF